MSGFASDWLALREPADRAARSPLVLDACRRYFADREALRVCDLGSGTGAAVRAFASLLPAQQHWLLTDNNAANLSEAARQPLPAGATLETAVCDLAADPLPWPADCGLVTATALFDLASPAWIDAFCGRLAADRLPLLATLTYNGTQSLQPPLPGDAAMIAAFNRHQHLDKGLGGPAAGPDAALALLEGLARRDYAITSGQSPWALTAGRDAALIAATLTGWAAAITEAGFVEEKTAGDWLAARLARTDRYTVGHLDLFATPPA